MRTTTDRKSPMTANRRPPANGPAHTQDTAEPHTSDLGTRSSFTAWLASRRGWITITVTLIAFAGVFFASSAPFAIPVVQEACGEAPLDVRTFSTADEVTSFLDACGAGGREAYRNMQLADLVYPAVFGLFMASSLAIVLRRLVPGRPIVAVAGAAVALAGAAFDYLENVFAWRALASFPEPAATNGLLGLASAAKNVSCWLAGVMLLVGVAALTLRALARRLLKPGAQSRPADGAISK